MGGYESTPAPAPEPKRPEPEPPKEFEKPWRKMHWGANIDLEQRLRDIKVKSNVRFVRLLVVGQVGAGKSSFTNSVNNVFQKRITCEALVDTTSGKSFTKIFKTHYIEGEDGSPLSFAFNDIMGLEDEQEGVNTQDIINAMRGILQEGYNFEDASSGTMKEPGYRSNPSLEDKTSCLVNIIAADKISFMPKAVIEKLKKIRQAATNLNIPQAIILTRPDLACPLVNSDLRKIYTSKKIKEKMEECSNLLGVPMNHIFPVKNYHEEIDTDDDMDLLILKALDQIVNISADALKKKTSSNPSGKRE